MKFECWTSALNVGGVLDCQVKVCWSNSRTSKNCMNERRFERQDFDEGRVTEMFLKETVAEMSVLKSAA